MARSQNSFTTEEVLSFLVDNYDIPGGGECSDISDMKDEVEDIDSVVNNSREMDEENANDGFDFDDIRQIDVVDAELIQDLSHDAEFFVSFFKLLIHVWK